MPIIVAGPSIASSAQIAPGVIVNSDINNSAAIDFSKVNSAGQIMNADINNSAAIADSKLAQITTASKVSGAALTSLASIPSNAGQIPAANLPAETKTIFATVFEDTGRYTETVTGSGTATYNTSGVTVFAGGGSSGSSNVTGNIIPAGANIYANSPLFSTVVGIGDHDSNLNSSHAFFGIGNLTVATAGITFTERHVGFKILKSGGTVSLYASQADGTTETASSALTTVVNGDVLELIFVMNGSSSVDYYWRKNGSALSSATNLTTNIPSGTTSTLQAACSTVNTASAATYTVHSMHYTR